MFRRAHAPIMTGGLKSVPRSCVMRKKAPIVARNTTRQTLVVSVAFIMVFGVASLFVGGNPSPRPTGSAKDDVELRTGTIQLAPDSRNLCRQLKYDNASGAFRDTGSGACADQ